MFLISIPENAISFEIVIGQELNNPTPQRNVMRALLRALRLTYVRARSMQVLKDRRRFA
jgi:hypothetical protein